MQDGAFGDEAKRIDWLLRYSIIADRSQVCLSTCAIPVFRKKYFNLSVSLQRLRCMMALRSS
jgi:hypothetical protein